MLGLIFRGIFLIGVLTWYSTSVWKMIDGYFRDQFRSYLEEEYRKNPRMKTDVQANSADKIDSVPTRPRPETTVEPQRGISEPDRAYTKAVEAVENDTVTAVESNEISPVTGGTSENEAAAWGSTDKNAFHGSGVESGPESRKLSAKEQDSQPPINHVDRDLERQENHDLHRSVSPLSKASHKRIKYKKKPTDPRDISRENQLPRRRNVKTITLNERDFKSATKHRVSNDDFWEFEEDAVEKEPAEGILVAELPFKPRADIGDLERVNADEYCPLTLEDEASCDETFKWP